MYKEDMGETIRILRKYVCGYSQRHLARMLNEDIETIRMLESGEILNPKPQLILRIATILDSFYMEFVKKEYEDEFLTYLEWGTHDEKEINLIKDLTLAIAEVAIKSNFA